MPGASKRLAALMVGMALFFTWAFCAFPTTEVNSVFQTRFDGAHFALLRLAMVGAIPAIVLPFFSKTIACGSHRIPLFATGCLVRLAGSYIDVIAVQLDNPYVSLLIGTFLMGIGTSIAIIFWGVLMHYGDTESNERAFVVTFIITGLLVIIIGFTPPWLTTAVLFLIPLAELACYRIACKNTVMEPGANTFSHKGMTKDFAALLARSCIAITLVGFIWEMFATSTQGFAYPKQPLFGAGLVASAVIIWLFTKYSSSVGFIAAARWALPIMSIGLLLCSFESPPAMIIACLLLAGGQGSLETILRMQIIDFSRRQQSDPLRIIGWGYSAIMLGAFLGPASFHIFGLDTGGIDKPLIIFILTLLVVISSLIFSNIQAPKNTGSAKQSSDIEKRADFLSTTYGLSPREREVLGYLLEGRSHPYIRDTLFISKSTVDTHVHHIYSKTHVKSKQELIDLSKQQG